MPRHPRVARRLLVWGTVVGLLAGLTGCSGAPEQEVPAQPKPESALPADIGARLDDALANAVTWSGATGAIAGVWAPWAGTWEAATGTAAKGDGPAMSTSMHFRIGTNTKAMTCTVLLELVDKKVVRLDDPVTKYLEDQPGIEGMTLRQLCQSTAGIADYSGALASQFVNNPTRDWPPLELLSNGLALKRTGEPGAGYATSNTGFILLGMALRKATGKSWPDLYQKYIFDPLGLEETSYPDAETLTIPEPHPKGYAYELGAKNAVQCESLLDDTDLSPSMYGVAGGVISTLDDSKQLIETVARGELLNPETATAQWETVPLTDKSPDWHGYGLGVETFGPMRGSLGVIPGFLSAMFSDPESGLTVVVMVNNSAAGTDFIKFLGQQLISIAADAPVSVSGAAAAPELPWAEEDVAGSLEKLAVCQPEPEADADAGDGEGE